MAVFRIPFVYAGEVIMKRAVYARTEFFVESLEVDIPVVSDREAPVALAWIERDQPQAVRHLNGRFMRLRDVGTGPVNIGGLHPHHPNSSAVDIAMRLHHRQPDKQAQLIRNWFDTPGFEQETPHRPDNVREWIFSGRRSALAKARRFASGMAIMKNGDVWFPVEEPKLVLTIPMAPTVSVDTGPSGFTTGVLRPRSRDPHSEPYFNACEMEAMAELAVERYGERALLWNVGRETYDLRMPEAFGFDRGRHAIDWAADAALDYVASDIRQLPDAGLAEWAALRRLVEEGDREDTGWEAAVAGRIELLVPHVHGQGRREALANAMAIWSDGDIRLDVPAAGPAPVGG